jgi:hypothetical protein
MIPGILESVRKLFQQGISPPEVAERLGVSVPTPYCWGSAASR